MRLSDTIVLIETLWNVNESETETELLTETVLIETLWNVNGYEAVVGRRLHRRFNRNIVECK